MYLQIPSTSRINITKVRNKLRFLDSVCTFQKNYETFFSNISKKNKYWKSFTGVPVTYKLITLGNCFNISIKLKFQIRTDRLMTLLPIPDDCVALDELPPSECPKGVLMELLGSLQHPYIYPVLDLGFLSTGGLNFACLVMPFNLRGSLKDLIYMVSISHKQ